MNSHSAGSTGVMESRLPRWRTRMPASCGWERSSWMLTSRVFLTSVTSTFNQRGLSGCCGGIVVLACRVELRSVGIGQPRDLDDARDAGLRAAGVVEESQIAAPHIVAHEVARLIVAHAPPCGGLARCGREVIDPEHVRLRFHQPVAHGSTQVDRTHAWCRCATPETKKAAKPLFSSHRRGPPRVPSGWHLEPGFKGGRFPSASGNSALGLAQQRYCGPQPKG